MDPGHILVTMPSLTIDLRDGWASDEVVISIDGVPRGRIAAVTTRQQIGLAVSKAFDVEAGPLTLEADVPTRGLHGSWPFEIAADHWVGISIVDGSLAFTDQAAPFGYA
jgi:hypothetical protein